MVNYTIDEAISSQDRIPGDVRSVLQEKLDRIQSGIKVVSVQLTRSTPPRQVKPAFEASTLASQKSEKAITEARTYAETTLNEAAGPVAEELFAALYDKTIDEQRREFLWSQLAGKAQEKLGDAREYATKVVENARANADYLGSLLPEYRERPKLVLQRIYLDAIENILNNAEEKFIIQTAEGAKGTEIRVLLNRDPSLKRQRSGSEETTQGNQ
jgi:membrane protease subunit HflK